LDEGDEWRELVSSARSGVRVVAIVLTGGRTGIERQSMSKLLRH
jgi:hypothetical protein